MNILEARKMIVNLLDLAIDKQKYVAVLLRSLPGLGKTSIMGQAAAIVAKQRGVKVTAKIVRLSEVEQPDVRGYALPPEGNAATQPMRFSLPFWAWDEERDGKYGILCLDELTQCNDDIYKVSAQLLVDRRVGDYTLPPGVIITATGNREADRSGVRKLLAFVQNRLMEIAIQPHKDSLIDFMERNGMHPATISFVEAHPAEVLRDAIPDKPGPFCTPRSVCMLDPLIGTLPMEQFTEGAQGLLGEGAGAMFISHLRTYEDVPSFEEICNSPKGAKVPDRPDATYAVMQKIAFNVTGETVSPAFTYLRRLGREFQAAGLRSALKRCPTIVQQPEFAQWLKDNKELLSAANIVSG